VQELEGELIRTKAQSTEELGRRKQEEETLVARLVSQVAELERDAADFRLKDAEAAGARGELEEVKALRVASVLKAESRADMLSRDKHELKEQNESLEHRLEKQTLLLEKADAKHAKVQCVGCCVQNSALAVVQCSLLHILLHILLRIFSDFVSVVAEDLGPGERRVEGAAAASKTGTGRD
jgi:hypothetical protein